MKLTENQKSKFTKAAKILAESEKECRQFYHVEFGDSDRKKQQIEKLLELVKQNEQDNNRN